MPSALPAPRSALSSAATGRGASRLPAVTADAWRNERREREGLVMGGGSGGSDNAHPQEWVGVGSLSEAGAQGDHFLANSPSISASVSDSLPSFWSMTRAVPLGATQTT